MANQSKEAAIAIIKEIIASASETANMARSMEADIRKPPLSPAAAAPSQPRVPAPTVSEPQASTAQTPPSVKPVPAPSPPPAAPMAEKKGVSEPAKEEVKSASQSDVLALISGGGGSAGVKKGN